MGLDYAIELEELVDWALLIIRYMARVIDAVPGSYLLAFGNLLTIIFKEFKVPLAVGHPLTKKDIINRTMALECNNLPAFPIASASLKAAGPMSQMMLDI